MASLKDLRNRISSVTATQKITRAMQMVAASKLRRAEEAAGAARPYAEAMSRVLSNLAGGMADQPGAPKLLAGTGQDQTHLLIVATADRGLCGGFNTSIVRLARQRIQALTADGKDFKIICVGSKGRDQLRRQYADKILETFPVGTKTPSFDQAHEIAEKVLAMFDNGEFDVATLFFSHFHNVVTQVPTEHRLIPADIDAGGEGADLQGAVYEYEPDEEEILADLLPRNVAVQIFRGLLENGASEQGARMSAMDNATRNAGDMIDDLTVTYNRTRQAQITKELIEIISGAEAL